MMNKLPKLPSKARELYDAAHAASKLAYELRTHDAHRAAERAHDEAKKEFLALEDYGHFHYHGWKAWSHGVEAVQIQPYGSEPSGV